MNKKNDFNFKFENSYFLKRNLNDPKRLKSFNIEKNLIKKYINFNGKVCDVGCSTGEFLEFSNWSGEKYGMEINNLALKFCKKIYNIDNMQIYENW